MCRGSDTLVGSKCLNIRKASTFAESAATCGRDYKFEPIASSFEQKWITAFFTNYDMMWVANTKDQLSHLKSILFEGKHLSNKEARLVDDSTPSTALAIITRKGATAGFTVGTITSVKEDTLLSVLCYREAELLDTYFIALVEKMRDAGLPTRVYNDAHGEKRNFMIVRSLVEFDSNNNEYGAGTSPLHAICKGFIKGYAASPLDFQNVNDFKQLLKNENVNIVAIPGNKDQRNKLRNLETCAKDPNFKQLRNQFYIDLPDGKRKVVQDHHWANTMPDRTCADTPRVALGFSQQGVVDLPGIARHFVVCTYGRPYQSETSDEEKTCHRLAYYDKKRKQCQCYKAEDDILRTKLFPLSNIERSIKPLGFILHS
ncbi:hypothetical protein Aduo_003976 [Ancylostoma duodenale]